MMHWHPASMREADQRQRHQARPRRFQRRHRTRWHRQAHQRDCRQHSQRHHLRCPRSRHRYWCDPGNRAAHRHRNDTVGAVSVPPNSGLTVSRTGALDHADTIAPGTASKVTFNSHGHITGTSRLTAADMPPATSTTLGAVIVPTTNDNPVRVDGLGNLTHDTSPVTPGTYVSVTVDNHGHVTDGSEEVLQIGQIPDLSADKITSGQFPTTALKTDSVTAPKLADYATCLMQEDNPGAGDFLGQFWYTPSTAQLRVYARGSGPQNIWLPVGFGALQARTCASPSPTTLKLIITSITQYGVSEGLTAGSAFPDCHSTPSLVRTAFRMSKVAGITMTHVNGDNFAVGDWALCLDGEPRLAAHRHCRWRRWWRWSATAGRPARRHHRRSKPCRSQPRPHRAAEGRTARRRQAFAQLLDSIGQWVNAPD